MGQSSQQRRSLDEYFFRLGERKLLTPEEEIKLAGEIDQQRRKLTQYITERRPDLVLFYFSQVTKNKKAEARSLYNEVSRILNNGSANGAGGRAVCSLLDYLNDWRGHLLKIAGIYETELSTRGKDEVEIDKREILVSERREFERLKRGWEDRFNDFYLANVGLVVSIARDHLDKGVELEDLIQEGNMGLVKGIDRFDYRRGIKFSTYGKWWILQGISRCIYNQVCSYRLPTHVHSSISKISQANKDLSQKLGRKPTTEEIAEGRRKEVGEHLSQKLGREPTAKEVAEGMEREVSKIDRLGQAKMLWRPVSQEEPLDEDNKKTLKEKIGSHYFNPSDLERDFWRRDLHGFLLSLHQRGSLTTKDLDCLVSKSGIALLGRQDGQSETLEEIGQRYEVSRERVGQILRKAYIKLGRKPKMKKLNAKLVELSGQSF